MAILTPHEFTAEFAARLRASSPNSNVEILRDMALRVTNPTGFTTLVFLDNCYADYRLFPTERDTIITKYLASPAGPVPVAKGWDLTKRIIPVIKDVSWAPETRMVTRAIDDEGLPEFVFDHLNDELIIVYAEDSEMSIRFVGPKEIERAGLRREELKDLAVKNLRTTMPNIEFHGVFMAIAGGNYEASLLLFDEIWSERRIPVDGDYVVAIPTRDLLLVAGSNSRLGIEKIKGMSRRGAADFSYPVISDLFTYLNGHFVRFMA